MIYVEAPSPIPERVQASVFLAGGITNCPDWQSDVAEMLSPTDLTVFNPRRTHFSIDDRSAAELQIKWEYDAIKQASVVLFWFSRGSLNPIVLFEYGKELGRRSEIIVGCDPDYDRKQDVLIQTMFERPDLYVHSSIEGLVFSLKGEVYHERLATDRDCAD